MNSSKRAAVAAFVAFLAASGGALAQQAAGRVLIAVGSVTVERGAQRIPAVTGTEVRKGDTLQVGAQSNAQVRFIDESLVALRPGTTFRINEFSFRSETKEKDSAVFALLKGGLRTVTGLVGRTNHEDYQVETPTATIGIRGTHYTLRVCADDCEESTGTAQAAPIHLAAAPGTVSDAGPLAQAGGGGSGRAPNGTYGSVTEGRINVNNQSGSRQFGSDQFFHVASRTAAATQLIGPPPFLRDRLEGRGRASGQSSQSQGGSQQQGSSQQQQQGGSQQQSSGGSSSGQASTSTSTGGSSGSESAPTVALTGQNGLSGDTRVSSVVATPIISRAVTPTVTQVTNEASTNPTSIIQATTSSSNLVYRLASTNLSITPTNCTGSCSSILTQGDFIVSVNPATQTARIVLAGAFNDGGLFNINNSYGDFPVVVSGNTMTVTATVNAADYPSQQGAFRCNDCGPGNTPGVFTSITYKVTISGGQATVSVSVVDQGGSGTLTAVLPQVDASSFTKTGAIAGRNFGANGGSSIYIQTNSAGQPIYFGEPLGIGNNINRIAGGTNTTIGSNAAAGNLVWGTWTGATTGVNNTYQSFTQNGTSVSPWIVGDLTNVLPPSLGTVSFSPVGWVVGNGGAIAGTLNSASLSADFLNRSLTLNINATSGPGGGTYVMNGVSQFSATNGRFSSGFSSVTCTGSCISPLGGNFNGAFTGANAAGALVSFSATNPSQFGIGGVIGFQRQ